MRVRMTLFLAGRLVELEPGEETRKQAPDFCDFAHSPVLTRSDPWKGVRGWPALPEPSSRTRRPAGIGG